MFVLPRISGEGNLASDCGELGDFGDEFPPTGTVASLELTQPILLPNFNLCKYSTKRGEHSKLERRRTPRHLYDNRRYRI